MRVHGDNWDERVGRLKAIYEAQALMCLADWNIEYGTDIRWGGFLADEKGFVRNEDDKFRISNGADEVRWISPTYPWISDTVRAYRFLFRSMMWKAYCESRADVELDASVGKQGKSKLHKDVIEYIVSTRFNSKPLYRFGYWILEHGVWSGY